MDDHKKYARARDQLYHYIVLQRKMHEAISPKHRTPELVQVMEMCELVVEQAKEAFENGNVLCLQLDHYSLVPLPGFEDILGETRNPYQVDGD
jgi:hypothetical protein